MSKIIVTPLLFHCVDSIVICGQSFPFFAVSMFEEDCHLHVYTWNYVAVIEKMCIHDTNVYVAIHWPIESICIGIESL